jgi:hypothetical protein
VIDDMTSIHRLTTVVRDGLHNAFTDLQHWQGAYWVGYRRGSGHVSMDGEAVVAVSADGKRFREVATLTVAGDVRDPKLVPLDDGRMAAFLPSWIHGYDRGVLQQYLATSTDGSEWTSPEPILERNRWLWRVRRHDGRFYGLVQDLTDGDPGAAGDEAPHELDLVVSDDLHNWEDVARIGPGHGLNESDIHFRADGEAWIISRTVAQNEDVGSYFAAADPPYTDWEVTPLRPVVHAPILLQHDGTLYVAGRCVPRRNDDGEGGVFDTHPFGSQPGDWGTAIWRVNRGSLDRVLELPASGDCAYPGLIEDPDGRVCLSYYSQHAYDTGVLDRPAELDDGIHESAADVYFAEIEL